MNIFILDADHARNAQYHVNSHVVKMPTEAAQMLSVAVRLQGNDCGFKLTHQNHPCSIWARTSIRNWMWLRDYAYALENEWRFRYGHPSTKTHKSVDLIRSLPTPNLPDRGLTEFALCMPDKYRSHDAIASYRAFYRADKAHLAVWGIRGKPDWWIIPEESEVKEIANAAV